MNSVFRLLSHPQDIPLGICNYTKMRINETKQHLWARALQIRCTDYTQPVSYDRRDITFLIEQPSF